jgi:hypothetical protein
MSADGKDHYQYWNGSKWVNENDTYDGPEFKANNKPSKIRGA